MTLLPSFREAIEVAGTPPLLDVTSAATGTTLESELLKELPTGGILNVVTKSGSNEFQGRVFGY